MKIKKVEIEGFRAYKFKKDGIFNFTNEDDEPSNFVAIYAPNGFGKSSFYDAVEWALTNHLERLGGEYNRNNFDLAAKSSKLKGVGLKILRNKDIPDDAPTSVAVLTTWRSYERSLSSRVRSNSRDLPLRPHKNKEAEYFREVILTQDVIDRFLREAKPHERYKRFMDFFCGDVEQQRKELAALINDNNVVLKDLKKKTAKLEEQLTESIDESIFTQFNSLAADLKSTGETIPFATPDFSTHTEHEILSHIVSRIHELKVLSGARLASKESLIEQISQLPNVQRNLDFIIELQPRKAMLNKGVIDAQSYQALQASNKKYMEELQWAAQKRDKLLEIKSLIPSYLTAEAETKVKLEQLGILAKQRALLVASISEMESLTKYHNDNLSTADKRTLLLRKVLTNSNTVYSELTNNQTTLATLNSQLSEKRVALTLDIAERDIIQAELDKVSAIQISAGTLLTQDVSSIGIDKEKLSELNSLAKEQSTLEMYDQMVRQTQDALNQQMGLHELLLSTGLEYLSAWPTDKCPLCYKEHSSSASLKQKVKENNLVSSLVKENSQKLEDSSIRQKSLRKLLDSIVVDVLTLQNKRLAGLRNRLKELGEKVSRIEQEKATVIAKIGIAETQIKALLNSVWSLEKDDLELRTGAELKSLELKREDLLRKITQQNLKIEEAKSQLTDMDSSISAHSVGVETTPSKTAYEKVKTYLTEHCLSSNELETHCSKGIEELEVLRKERRKVSKHTIEQCNILHNEMDSLGTWIDFASLATQKDEVELLIVNTQSSIDAFFEKTHRLIGKKTDMSIDTVRSSISEAIDNLTEQHKQFEIKINQFDLLTEQLKSFKPYLISLEARKSLNDMERYLAQRQHVDEKLKEERYLVIAKLEERIGAFFFTDLINAIYSKIDPHPSFKEVEFSVDFEAPENPGLHIKLKNEVGDSISPILYFSAAQLNILSLSVFLANALHATDDRGTPIDVILIDDPIQSMDSINVLSTIDLLKSISIRFNKQIIISTHDENFFGLLQRKVPSQVFGSKFLRLESFGVVAPAEPFFDA